MHKIYAMCFDDSVILLSGKSGNVQVLRQHYLTVISMESNGSGVYVIIWYNYSLSWDKCFVEILRWYVVMVGVHLNAHPEEEQLCTYLT